VVRLFHFTVQTTVIVAAAGPGTRLGATEPKAFVGLQGVPLFIHTLRSLLAAPSISRAILVIPSAQKALAEEWMENLGPWRCPVQIVSGGAERQDSVRAGLASAETALVAVHDAARPFIDADVVEAAIVAAAEHGASIVAAAATDTTNRVDSDGWIVTTIPRQDVWLAQTPQVFLTEVLREAHAKAMQLNLTATDDSALVERLGYRVRVVPGNSENRKITTAADLRWAEWLLDQRAPR
jgi:2-C-methyl-D-erythritol 4-phosphate cytidylyltransferase